MKTKQVNFKIHTMTRAQLFEIFGEELPVQMDGEHFTYFEVPAEFSLNYSALIKIMCSCERILAAKLPRERVMLIPTTFDRQHFQLVVDVLMQATTATLAVQLHDEEMQLDMFEEGTAA